MTQNKKETKERVLIVYGPPGSGKSTHIKKEMGKNPYFLVDGTKPIPEGFGNEKDVLFVIGKWFTSLQWSELAEATDKSSLLFIYIEVYDHKEVPWYFRKQSRRYKAGTDDKRQKSLIKMIPVHLRSNFGFDTRYYNEGNESEAMFNDPTIIMRKSSRLSLLFDVLRNDKHISEGIRPLMLGNIIDGYKTDVDIGLLALEIRLKEAGIKDAKNNAFG